MHLNYKGSSDARVVSLTKKEYGFVVHFFVKIHKSFKVNIWWLINCDLLKLSFVWNFYNKVMGGIQSNIFWYDKIRLQNKRKRLFSFLSLINNSVTIRLRFLLLSNHIVKYDQYFTLFIRIVFIIFFVNTIYLYHQKQSIFYTFYLDSIHQCFCKYHSYH